MVARKNMIDGLSQKTFLNLAFTSSTTLLKDSKDYLTLIPEALQKTHSQSLVTNEQLLSILLQIREQNKQILTQVNKNQIDEFQSYTILHENFPVSLPLQTAEDIFHFENYLLNNDNKRAVIFRLSRLGGKNLVTIVNNIMKYCLTNELACSYSFYGKRLNKRPFCGLHLKSVVIAAVQQVYRDSTENNIESAIKVWLKHAPQRLTSKLKKRECNQQNTMLV
ncbi:hypothetical protein FQA39_LY11418 [Lamprigera yunnana]|nr:hypothetical protein FQA39_LY11418 [Lamprigera yunnana]